MKVLNAPTFLIIYLVSLVAEVKSTNNTYTPDDVCAPNPVPNQSTRLSVPMSKSSCRERTLKSLSESHPDKWKTTPELLEKHGYTFQTHKVTTKDDYILTLFRITSSPKFNKSANSTQKPAVYVQHGILMSSDCWFFLTPFERNLPIKLADLGYDVWIGNARGTTYSLDHWRYTSTMNLEYWDYSFHELGVYDFPAVLHRILKVSKTKKIFYVGHSMGTSKFFVALSEKPKLQNKIIAGFMLAPVAYIGHSNSVFRALTPLGSRHAVFQATNLFLHGVVQQNRIIRKWFGLTERELCDFTAFQCGFCDNLLYALFGYNEEQTNVTEIPNIVSKLSNTISVKTIAHFLQGMSRCTFKKYDYGPVSNLKIYGSTIPPDYELNKITIPTYFYYSDQDQFTQPNDILITASKFSPGVLKLYRIKNDLFNHLDFLTAIDTDKLLYNVVVDDMEQIWFKNQDVLKKDENAEPAESGEYDDDDWLNYDDYEASEENGDSNKVEGTENSDQTTKDDQKSKDDAENINKTVMYNVGTVTQLFQI